MNEELQALIENLRNMGESNIEDGFTGTGEMLIDAAATIEAQAARIAELETMVEGYRNESKLYYSAVGELSRRVTQLADGRFFEQLCSCGGVATVYDLNAKVWLCAKCAQIPF